MIEQWKRIAGRIVHASPPISRQYCQTAACVFEPPNDNIPDVLGSYRRPGRPGIDQETPSTTVPSLFRTSRRKILFSLIFIGTIATVLTAVIVAVVLGKRFDFKIND